MELGGSAADYIYQSGQMKKEFDHNETSTALNGPGLAKVAPPHVCIRSKAKWFVLKVSWIRG